MSDKDSGIVHPASKPVEDQTDARSSYLQSASTQSRASFGGFSMNSSARYNSNPRIQPPCGTSTGLHLCHKPTPYMGKWIFNVPDYSGYDERHDERHAPTCEFVKMLMPKILIFLLPLEDKGTLTTRCYLTQMEERHLSMLEKYFT